MVRIQWIMKPFPGQNDQAMENVKKFAKLWKDQGANTVSYTHLTLPTKRIV